MPRSRYPSTKTKGKGATKQGYGSTKPKPRRGTANPATAKPTAPKGASKGRVEHKAKAKRGKADPRTATPKRRGGTVAARKNYPSRGKVDPRTGTPKPRKRGTADPRTGTPKPRPRRGTADPRAGTPKPKPSRNVAHSGGIGHLADLESFRRGLDKGLKKAGRVKSAEQKFKNFKP